MSPVDRLDALERLHRLKQAGALSDGEYAAEKARLFGGGMPVAPPGPAPVAEIAPVPPARSSLSLWIGGSLAALLLLIGGAWFLFSEPLVPVSQAKHRAAAPRAHPSPLADPSPAVLSVDVGSAAPLAAVQPTPRGTDADDQGGGPTVPSLDGGYTYRLANRYATSAEVVQVRTSDGRTRDVIDGNAVRVIRNGPYRGYLLVERHKYRPEGGSWDPTDLVRPDGKVLTTLPPCEDGDGESCVSDWLDDRGWRAS